MSQQATPELPQTSIDQIKNRVTGMVYAEISKVDVYQQESTFANTENKRVNVYTVTLKDNTGEIRWSDWCKKHGGKRTYRAGDFIKFDHAKLDKFTRDGFNYLKPEPKTKVALVRGGAYVTRYDDSEVSSTTAAATTPALPGTTIPTIQPQVEWEQVKTKYPNFYNAVDGLFNGVYPYLTPEHQQLVAQQFESYIKMIWGG